MIKGVLLLALASFASAEGGWSKRGASLLLHDSTGELVNEIGLSSSEEGGAGKLVVRETRGAAAKSGRFAWTFERTNAWNASRSKLLESKRLFKLLGLKGEEVWTSDEADAAENLEPAIFSDTGEILLLSSRAKEGWRVAARGHLGNTVMQAFSMPDLEDMRLTRDGKYAMIRWTIPDKESTHTFWNVAERQRKDLPSSALHLGRAVLGEDGKVTSNGKLVFDLSKLVAPPEAPKPEAPKPEAPKP